MIQQFVVMSVTSLNVSVWPGVELVGEVWVDGDPGHVITLHRPDLFPMVVLAQADLDGDPREGVRPPTSGADLHAAEVHAVARSQHVPGIAHI